MKDCTGGAGEVKVKRIMFVIPSLCAGGAERVVSELANEFSNIGLDVGILLVSKDAVVYDLNPAIKLISLEEGMKGHKWVAGMFKRCVLIRGGVKRFNPDLVLSFLSVINIYTCASLLFSRYKLIVSVRNDPGKDPPDPIKRRIRDFVYRYADGYVFQTGLARGYFPTEIREKSAIIPNPLKNDLPGPYNGEREKRIVAVGRLEGQKNYPLLLKAYALLRNEHPDYILDIFGEGSQRACLESLTRELGVGKWVNFRGVVSNVHDLMEKASLYVLTSDYEGMPNALMEAMAMGLPCIASRCPCGGPAMLINHGENGLLFEVGDKNGLLLNMKKVLKDGDLAGKLSANAVKIKSTYRLADIARRWLAFAETVVSRE